MEKYSRFLPVILRLFSRHHQHHHRHRNSIIIANKLSSKYFVYSVYRNAVHAFVRKRFCDQTHYARKRKSVIPQTRWSWDILTTVLIFFGVIEDLEKSESPLILSIKRGILAKQRKEYHKADLILHSALKMAQDLCYTDAETYIFDVMGDNCFERKDFAKAKDLYLEVVGRLAAKENFRYDGEELCELSVKLAFCYSNMGELDSAEKGFQFAIDTQLGRTSKFWNDKLCQLLPNQTAAAVDADVAAGSSPADVSSGSMEIRITDPQSPLDDVQRNSLALLGYCYDYYSRHLERNTTFLRFALTYRLKALSISRVVNGVEHDQTLLLENDIADLYVQLDNFDQAKQHLRAAIDGAKRAESADLPIYYLNMASLHYHQNRTDLAQPYCHKSLDFLRRSKVADEISSDERKMLQEKSQLCIDGKFFY